MAVTDDVGHLGVVQPVEHHIHDQRGDIQGHQAVQGAVQVAEGDGHRHDDHQVDDHQQLAHGQPGQTELQEAGDEIGAPGGSPL